VQRIAVLGATGAAGRAFVPRAAARGHALMTERVDILDRDALAARLAGCDAAVNLVTSIPKPGGRGDWKTNDRVRREGTANLLRACAEVGVPVVVQQSVAMLHCVADDRPQSEDDPIEGYGGIASAFDMEQLVRASPLDVRIVRGGLFYGPNTHREAQWRAELADPAFRVPGDGSAWWSLVHVEDYASAVLQVLEQGAPREAYIACDDAPLRVADVYACVAASLGAATPEVGGPQRLRSFRTSNRKLRALGWRPRHAVFAP